MTSDLIAEPLTSAVPPPLQVEIFFPEAPFGGVIVQPPSEEALIVAINSGSPVHSVFGRTGDIFPEFGDYDSFYAPLGAGLPRGGTTGQQLAKLSGNDYDVGWTSAGEATVLSVFGRVGAVLAQVGDYSAFYAPLGSQLPAGGSTGQVLQKTSAANFDASWVTPPAPPVIPVNSVFGRTGAIVAQVGDYSAFYQPLGNYQAHSANLDLWAATTPSAFQPAGNYELALGNPSTNGYILSSTVAGVRSWVAPPSAPVSSVFTRTGAIVAQAGDYAAFYQRLGSYEAALGNPSANGYILSSTTAGVRSWIAPPSAPVSSVFTRTGAIVAQAGDYAAFYQPLGSYEAALGNPSTNGYILSSTAAGVRSWIAPSTGVTWPLLAPDGSGAAPSYSFSGAPTTGFFRTGAFVVALSAGVNAYAFSNAQRILLASGGMLCWTNGDVTATNDIGLARNAANILELNTGTVGTFADLKLRNLIASGTITGPGSVPVGGAAGTVLGKLSASNYDVGWVTASGGGTVTSLTVNSPLSGTPNPITDAGTIDLLTNVDLALAAMQTIKVVDTATGLTNSLTIGHNIAGTPTVNLFGTSLLIQGKSDTVNDRSMGQIWCQWTTLADATRSAKLGFKTALNGSLSDALVLYSNGGFDLVGTKTNDNASAGNVGQVVTSVRTTALSITGGVAVNVVQISLTAGDWDVRGSIIYNLNTLGASGSASFGGNISVGTSATVNNDGYNQTTTAVVTGVFSNALAPRRVSIPSTTTVYLCASFGVAPSGTATVTGFIEARRIR